MNHVICSCGVVCEGPEGPIVALLEHKKICPQTILNFRRRESNPDEADRLMREAAGDDARNDADYIDYLAALRNGRNAFHFLEGQIAALVAQADFTPNAALRTLLHDARAISRGFGIHNSQSSTCDCTNPPREMFDGRCVGCGAGLAPEMRERRREVGPAS